jgi:hypothetical protein
MPGAADDPRVYAAEQLELMLGGRVSPPEDLLDRLARALTREEERGAAKDAHDNFPASSSALFQGDQLEAPPLDAEIARLAAGHPDLPPRWPRGHRFAAVLSHDVDRVVSLPWRDRLRQTSAVGRRAGAARRARWRAVAASMAVRSLLGRSDRAPFDPWIAEEGRLGFRSSFFTLPERLAAPSVHDNFYRYDDSVRHGGRERRLRDALRAVHESGWEIGLHGSYASSRDAAILADERAQVEAAVGAEVTSTRQHYLRFAVEQTPRVQEAAGLRADSTLGYSSTVGLRAGISLPFYWAEAPGVLEVPLAIQDVGLLRVHGPRVDVAAATERARALIRRIADSGGVATLSWHIHAESPGALECYRALLETVAELGGWGCSLGELERWWRSRAEDRATWPERP